MSNEIADDIIDDITFDIYRKSLNLRRYYLRRDNNVNKSKMANMIYRIKALCKELEAHVR